MMKIFCFIFSIYVLLLSTVPCCSDDNCNDEIKTELSDNYSKDHKETDNNACSPFFACCSCSGFVFSNFGFDFKEVNFMKDNLVAVYKSQFIDDFFAKIWQPPKTV